MAPKKIHIKQYVDCQKEAPAAAEITPGELLEEVDGKVQPHSSAGENCIPLVAKEEGYIGRSIDETYSEDDQVRYEVGHTGERFYMLLGAGEDVGKDDLLESAGNGALQAHDEPTADGDSSVIQVDAARFKAVEAVDNSGETEKTRIRVEVIK
ncbi:hypothetical protein [Fuchsiella alkaliacetigena]|uniref:hypothetical protein n=1 Tax=Fuchsiella alkaliacetigena TaxID=957042 RepID=UPI00200A685D|nr:hypothetical protein [Fuchsiella alkaliacetigena]MCK8824725.1 hypothetical protein [Fuchsiella alkaliacetigena]